jgi:hypothetical protein
LACVQQLGLQIFVQLGLKQFSRASGFLDAICANKQWEFEFLHSTIFSLVVCVGKCVQNNKLSSAWQI